MNNYASISQYLLPLLRVLDNLQNRLSDNYVYAPLWISFNSLPQPPGANIPSNYHSDTHIFNQTPRSNQTSPAIAGNNYTPPLFKWSLPFDPVNSGNAPLTTSRSPFTCRDFILSCIEQLRIQITSETYDEDEDFSLQLPQFTQRINNWATNNLFNILGDSQDLNTPYSNSNLSLNTSLFSFPTITIDINALFEFKFLIETIQVYLRSHVKKLSNHEYELSAENLKSKIDSLNTEIDKYKDTFSLKSHEADELNTVLDTLTDVKSLIDNWKETDKYIREKKSEIDTYAETCKTNKETISSLKQNANDSAKKIESAKNDFYKNKAKYEKEIEDLLKKCELTQKELIGNALAREFKNRSKNNFCLAIFWFVILCGIVIFITCWSLKHFDLDKGWLNLLGNELPCLLLLWPAWVASRQLSSSLSLKEDYAFKAAASTAYSRYKEEIGSQDPSLQNRLVGSVLNRFDEHPLRFISKESPATPLGEIIALLNHSDLKKLFEILSRFTPDQINALLSAEQSTPYGSADSVTQSSSKTASAKARIPDGPTKKTKAAEEIFHPDTEESNNN